MADTQNPAFRIRETPFEDVRRLAASGYLYAVVDSCNAPSVPRKVMELGEQRAVSLYRGSAEEEFWDVAPYLLKVDEPVLDWILSDNTKEAWGIFAATKDELEVVRRHFRRFLRVQAPNGEVWLFRFYDPRVLKAFLPACTPEELRLFFGPVLALGVADPKSKNGFFYQETCVQASPVARPASVVSYPLPLRLRDAHVEALKPQGDLALAEEIMEFLRLKNSAFVNGLADDVLRQRVLSGLVRARKYGFKRLSTLAGFITIMFRIAPNFDEQKAIHAVLTDSNIPPDWRIDELVLRIAEKDWGEAVASSDPSAWKPDSV